jgi:CRISPR-associated exonuclease Cas4
MEEDDFILISALQHYSYCPRQCALIHAEQSFADNVYTARGNADHKAVDLEGYESHEMCASNGHFLWFVTISV